MNTVSEISLSQACTNISRQFLNRYGAAMFRKLYGEPSNYATELSGCLKRVGITGPEAESLQRWLLTGIKAFAEFPPSFENMVQMGQLLKNFPFTPAQQEILDFWRKVDAIFSQNYGRMWRGGDALIDTLQRERTWLTNLEEMGASHEELEATLTKVRACVAFRSYPPNLEQFGDALTALRINDAPLVEDAWLQAISMKPGQSFHPLVKRARGTIGAFDLNVGERDRNSEMRFKQAYLDLLRNPSMETLEDHEQTVAVAAEYMDTASMLDRL